MLKNNASLKPILKAKFSILIIASASLILSACATPSRERQKPVPVDDKTVQTNTSYNKSAIVIGEKYKNKKVLDTDSGKSRADKLLKRSESAPQDVKATMQMRAAEIYISENDSEAANNVVSKINTRDLSGTQQSQYAVLKAKSFVDSGKYQEALNTLSTIKFSEFRTSRYQSEYLLNVSRALIGSIDPTNTQSKLKKTANAMDALIKREAYLNKESRITQNHHELWQITDTLTAKEIDQIHSETPSEFLKNWLASSRLKRVEKASATTPEASQVRPTAEPQVANKQDPLAPVGTEPTFDTPTDQVIQPVQPIQPQIDSIAIEPEVVGNLSSVNSVWDNSSPKRIALLLPLSSKFANAARAFEDGFKAAHRQNNSVNKPQIGTYNIDTAEDVLSLVQRAVSEGADYIVGPLGKASAQRVLDNSYGNIPILALGGAINSPNSIHSVFTLSPEQEAYAIAQHAINNGQVKAAVLAPLTARGARVKQAFERAMTAFGGSVVATADYAPNQYDHGSVIKDLLSINASESRHRQLSATIGFRPKFTPARRSDVDFLLLVGKSNDARVIKPQLSFYQAHSLTTYATSSVFSGAIDAVNDADLDNVIFPAMPMLLDQINQGSQTISPNSRLYAFGLDAYNLVPLIDDLKLSSGSAYPGVTGKLSLNSRGEVLRQPDWAKFKDGIPTGSTSYHSSSQSQTSDQFGQPAYNQNENKVINRSSHYDSKTWDARSNRRTTQP